MSKKYRIQEFAERVGRCTSTIRRWEREGKILPKRHTSGHRYFDEGDVRPILGGGKPVRRKTVVYCRASSAGQKDDLASQVRAMETYCLATGIAVDEWIQEIGSSMNFKRKRFLALLDGIVRGEVAKVVVAHKDRLMRFGFECLAHIAEENDCEIEVVNQESLSPQQEMVEDLMMIVHTFSCRLYGLRKYKKVLREDFPATKTVRTEIAE